MLESGQSSRVLYTVDFGLRRAIFATDTPYLQLYYYSNIVAIDEVLDEALDEALDSEEVDEQVP